MEQVITSHYKNWSLQIDVNNILWLTFDQANSQVNTLNRDTLGELEQIITSLEQNKHAKALVIRSAKKTFIVGADIDQFKHFKTSEEAMQFIRRGQEIFNKLEALEIPTIALIEGYCLGGGLELSLACNYRIAIDSPKTKIGLPEVKLGIHPGWGGTVRLPKLIGPFKSMDVILTGRNLSAKSAKKLGVVNEALPARLIEEAVKTYALNPNQKKTKWDWNKIWQFKLPRNLGKIFYTQLNKKIIRAHYPAPYSCCR